MSPLTVLPLAASCRSTIRNVTTNISSGSSKSESLPLSPQLIVENILRQYNKRLDERQMSMLLEKEGSANPLWLTLACEELRVYGHFNKMDEKIASLSDDLIR